MRKTNDGRREAVTVEKWIRKTIELGAGLILTGKYNPSVVPYYPQKTALPREEKPQLLRTYPERVGIASGRLLAMLRALEKEKRANVHNLLVSKGGAIISECSHPGYSTNTWHLAHSMSKSITALAVGFMVDDGLLSVDTPVCELFPELRYTDKKFGDIRVKNLLNMTSGVRFNEAGAVSETAWSEAFFASAVAFAPGTKFHYNSMNSYMLARIVCRLSGRSLTELLRERLFGPLGITNYFWEIGPEGVEKGGWGLFMSAESWCKVGIMMLGGGTYERKRILSSDWIAECTATQVETPSTLGNYNYGYQMWVSRDSEAVLFNGMLGQDVWISPLNNVVVCLNSGNNELFQNSPALRIIETYLGRDLSHDLTESCFSGDLIELRKKEHDFFTSRHWIRPYKPEKRRGLHFPTRHKNDIPDEWGELVGRYSFTKNNYGILPLFMRGMQNNLKSSIDSFAIERVNDKMYFTVSEGGTEYRMEIGFTDFADNVINYHGERYIVRVIGEAMEDEDREMLYKLELLFPEMPNVRTLKLSMPEEGMLLVRMSESPNDRIADIYFEELGETNPRLAFFYELLEKRFGKRFVQNKLKDTFSPTLIGGKVGSPNYTAILDGEREKKKAGEKTVKLVNTFIAKFIHDEDEMEEADRGGFRGFLDEIIGRIKQKIPTRSAGIEAAVLPSSELLLDGEDSLGDTRVELPHSPAEFEGELTEPSGDDE